MFKCDKCQKSTKDGEKINYKVIEKREVQYKYLVDKYGNKTLITENNPPQQKGKIIKTKGWEIVRELKLCGECND